MAVDFAHSTHFRWLLCCIFWYSSPLAAVDRLEFSIESLSGAGWEAQNLSLHSEFLAADALSLQLQLAQLRFSGYQIRALDIHCSHAHYESRSELVCDQGSVSLEHELLGRGQGRLRWRYVDARHWQLTIRHLTFAKLELSLELRAKSDKLRLDYRIGKLDAKLFAVAVPAGWTLQGLLQAAGRVSFSKGELKTATARGTLTGLSWSSDDGLQVGEAVQGEFNISLKQRVQGWETATALRFSQGQVYSDPFYFEIGKKQPVALSAQVHTDAQWNLFDVDEFSLNHASIELGGSLKWNRAKHRLQTMQAEFAFADLSRAYALLVQPLVIGTALDDIKLKGRLSGTFSLRDARLDALSVVIPDADLEQHEGLFGISGLQASVHWKRSGAVSASQLSWRRGHAYDIDFGGARIGFEALAGVVRWRPVTLPLLGGELRLSELKLQGLLGDAMRWQGQARLQNIRLAALSQAMNWPEMDGSLQAQIPRLHYENNVLNMDGELRVDVFDGQIVIEALRLQDPLGVAPVLETGVRLSNLDLQQMTQVFSLGRIEGSLEGYVRNLQLVGWTLNGFDAYLHSPAQDQRRHRISQRAIDNLTEIGNGVTVDLSKTMLRFFEDFAYEQLALKVKLRGGYAFLDGVRRDKGGYYIVKGARLPRIDVIGRNHKVAWKELLSRIQAIRFDEMIVE